MTRDTSPVQSAVLLRCGATWYGVPLASVRTVIATPVITPLPFVPPYLRGLASVRGELLSVIDLPTFLQQTAAAVTSRRLVVVSTGTLEAGLLADEVTAVVELPMQGPPADVEWSGRTVHLLSIPELLEVTRLHGASEIRARAI